MGAKLKYLEITIADQDGVIRETLASEGLDLRRKLHRDTFIQSLELAIEHTVARAGLDYEPSLPSEEEK